MNKTIIKEFFYYISAIFLCLIFLYWAMKLWLADLTVPFVYIGDAVYFEALIKGTIDNGWYLINPFVGMPSGLNLSDFPQNWFLDPFIMKLMAYIIPDWALILNIFFLLTFPLTAVISLFVLRKINISPLPAITGSILFAFIPYHFLRGEGHITLAAYYLIPLIILVTFWIFEDNFLLNQFKGDSKNQQKIKLNWRSLFAIIICIGIASTNIYYALFSCFFLIVAGFCAAVSGKKLAPLLNASLLIGIMAICIVVYNIPTLLYQYQNGNNPEAIMRFPQESEIYGLKIVQMLLPVPGHPISLFARLAVKYAQTAPLANENNVAGLGMVGSIGFIILILWVFYRVVIRNANNCNETCKKLNQISVLNLAAVLLATIGGFGTVLAYLILPQIRGYNRISIFIAFLAIAAVMLLINLLITRYSFSRIRKWIINICLIAVLFFGIYDQSSTYYIPDYKNTKEQFLNDKRFINTIETRFPNDNMVFQLPYVAYPGYPQVNAMSDYDHFKAYLHSKNIHWSYGAMRGRDGDLWQRNIISKPMGEMIEGLSFAGFNGIYVDGYGYADSGKEIISSISSTLNETPLVSDNGRLYFFDMTSYGMRLKSKYTPAELAKQIFRTLNLLTVEWPGFSDLEGTPAYNWRWCSSQGTLILTNPSDKERTFIITAKFLTGYPELSNLNIESPLVTENLKINNTGYTYTKEIIIPPGKHAIKFNCDAKRHAPADPRYIVFGTFNFQIVESE